MPQRAQTLKQWVEAVLGTQEVTPEPASPDASFRRYFRVRAGAGSFIVMDAPPDKENCVPYVHVSRLLRHAGLSVPEILAADLGQGFLLLTDLGDTRYLEVLTEDNAERLYGDAFDALLTMQTRAATDDLPAYDEALLREEMALFPEWFLGLHLGLELAAADRAVLEEAFGLLCRSAQEQPQVFVHRDYHSRNLMLLPERNPGILDFQDAVRGPVTYDPLSLLRDVYVRWPPERVDHWAGRYRERLVEQGLLAREDRARFRRWFDLMGVQRHLKVAGIFARLYHRDGKPAYLQDIPLTLEYLLAESAGHRELDPLRRLLERLRVPERLQARNAEVLSC